MFKDKRLQLPMMIHLAMGISDSHTKTLELSLDISVTIQQTLFSGLGDATA
jgi:hypothetical protein